MLSVAREAGSFSEVAALHSDHVRQVPLYYSGRSMEYKPMNCEVHHDVVSHVHVSVESLLVACLHSKGSRWLS